MTSQSRKIAVILALLSPFAVSWTMTLTQDMGNFGDLGQAVLISLGLPIVGVIGLLTTVVTKNSPNAYVYSSIGFIVPAVLLDAWLILISVSPDGLVKL